MEVVGAPEPEEATTRVTVGGGPGRRGRLLLVVLAVVAAVVASTVVLGGEDAGDDEEERAAATTSTSSRRSGSTRAAPTSTAPLVTAPHGPVLPEPTGGALLLGRYDGGDRWVHLDLDTGARTELQVRLGEVHPPVPVRGGVVTSTGSESVYQPLPHGDPVPLGSGAEVHPVDAEHVWLVSGSERSPEAEGPRTARLLEVQTGERRAGPFSVPNDAYAAGATTRGLVLVAGGRSYLLDEDGAVTPLTTGDVLAASAGTVVVNRCDDRIRCGLWAVDVEGGEERRLDGVPEVPAEYGRVVVIDAAGRVAVGVYDPGLDLWVSGADDPSRGTVHEASGHLDLGGWLPGGQGLAAVSSARSQVVRCLVVGGELVERPIAAVADDRADFVVVIPP